MRGLGLSFASFLIAACTGAPIPSATGATAGPSVPGASMNAPATLAPSPSAPGGLSNPGGSAMNGPIVYSTAGDVFSLDPATGVTTLMIGGPTTDEAPYFSPDGKKLVIHRSDDAMLYISGPDGSGLKPWANDKELTFWTWSPDSSRIAAISEGGSAHDLIIWDGGAGKKTHINVDATANFPMWADPDTLLLVEENADLSAKLWTVEADGSGLKPVSATRVAIGVGIRPETGELFYSDFVNLNPGSSSSVHVLDVRTGVDTVLQSTVAASTNYFWPRLSPDGRWIVVDQFAPGLPANRSVLVRADGTGTPLPPWPRSRDPSGQLRDVLPRQHAGPHYPPRWHVPVLHSRRSRWPRGLADRGRRPRGEHPGLAARAGLISPQ